MAGDDYRQFIASGISNKDGKPQNDDETEKKMVENSFVTVLEGALKDRHNEKVKKEVKC